MIDDSASHLMRRSEGGVAAGIEILELDLQLQYNRAWGLNKGSQDS